MQDFTRAQGRLRRLPVGARLVYSAFLLFTLAGLAMTGWLAREMLGPGFGQLGPYYAGAPQRVTDEPQRGDGPALDLPAEADAVVQETMPVRKLLEVTHFHLFSMPVTLMVLCHLFMLARVRDRTKWTMTAVATLATALHIAAPWLVRAHSGPLSATLYAASGALLGLTFLAMALVPLWEMWFSRD